MLKIIKEKFKLTLLMFLILLVSLSLSACDSGSINDNGSTVNDNLTSGFILGKLDNLSAPISQREVKINNSLVTTNNKGKFQINLNTNTEMSSLSNNNKIIIELPGFNRYVDYNWYEGKKASLIPYLGVVKVEPVSPATYQHVFQYYLPREYNAKGYPEDFMKFKHKDKNLEYDLVYNEKGNMFKNKEDNWTPLNDIYTGKWEFNGIIEGESVSGEFIVDPPKGLVENSPEIIDYELFKSSITVNFNIPHSVDRAWIRTSDIFHQIPESSLDNESINISYKDLNINPNENKTIYLFIQTGNIGKMEFGLQIKSIGTKINFVNALEEGTDLK